MTYSPLRPGDLGLPEPTALCVGKPIQALRCGLAQGRQSLAPEVDGCLPAGVLFTEAGVRGESNHALRFRCFSSALTIATEIASHLSMLSQRSRVSTSGTLSFVHFFGTQRNGHQGSFKLDLLSLQPFRSPFFRPFLWGSKERVTQDSNPDELHPKPTVSGIDVQDTTPFR